MNNDKPPVDPALTQPVADKVSQQVKDLLALAERRCPRCQGSMVHSRLRGWHCWRECGS